MRPAAIILFLFTISLPSFAQVHQDLSALFHDYKFDSTLLIARNYLVKDQRDASASCFIGQVYFEYGQYDSAKWHLQQALDFDKDKTVVSCWAHFYMSQYCYVTGNKTGAEKELKKSINRKATDNMKYNSRHLLKVMGMDKSYKDWRTIEREHIIFHFPPTLDSASISEWIKIEEDRFAVAADIFKPVLPKKIDFYVWEDPEEMHKVLLTPYNVTHSDVLISHAARKSYIGIQVNCLHWAWGNGKKRWNKFGVVGICLAFDTQYDSVYARAEKAVHGIFLKDVRDMWASPEIYADEALYPIAGAFIFYLIKHSTEEQIRGIETDQTVENAKKVYGDRFDTYAHDFNKLIGLQQ